MTLREIACIAAAASAANAGALNLWYDTPRQLGAGTEVVDASYSPVERATIHARIASSNKAPSEWSLAWNYTDADNCTMATLSLPGTDIDDPIYGKAAYLTVVTVRRGTRTVVDSRELRNGIDTDGGFNSLKLVYEAGRARLFYGKSGQTEIGYVPFDPTPGQICVIADSPVECRRLQTSLSELSAPEMSAFGTAEALAAHIAKSDDPMECIWEYIDRNVNQDKAVAGGRYTLATVKTDNGYDIVYLRGATNNSRQWPAMRIKGRLTPTIFKGNYDMVWHTSEGITLTDDTNAQVSDDHALLTLRFPLLDAEIRLRRVKNLNTD